jgi:hypothetical protein
VAPLRGALASLRFVGVSSAELSAPDAFAAYAIAFWAGAVFPLTSSRYPWGEGPHQPDST